MIHNLKKSFRIIPVLDLKDGLVVRGIRGERAKYQPVKSNLTSSAEFLKVMEAINLDFGLTEFYMADLDALISGGEKNQLSLINRKIITSIFPFSLMLDAGVHDVKSVAKVLQAGVNKVVVGTETLPSLEVLREIIDTFGSQCLVASIDTKDSKVISPSSQISKWSPPEAINQIYKVGIKDFILLQLTRVGTGEGLDKTLIQDCLSALSENGSPLGTLMVGGGISSYEDLRWLADNGVGGALVASALHDGRLDRKKFQAFHDGKSTLSY